MRVSVCAKSPGLRVHYREFELLGVKYLVVFGEDGAQNTFMHTRKNLVHPSIAAGELLLLL